jgi:hypothetical protein
VGNTVIAFAASALSRVAATPALEVKERAVTRGDSRGQVCPSTGGTGFRAATWHGSDLSIQASSPRTGGSTYGAPISAFSLMNNVQVSKPRYGYSAMSGTG